MCYNSDLEDESCCDEGEEVHAYKGPKVIAPEEVAAPEPIASGSVDRLFVSAAASTFAEEDQGQPLQGGQ